MASKTSSKKAAAPGKTAAKATTAASNLQEFLGGTWTMFHAKRR